MVLAVCFSIMLGFLVFFSYKRIPFILPLHFCIMELKSHSPSIFIYIFLDFLYDNSLRVVLKFFLDLGNSYLVFIVLSNAWYFNLLVSFKYCLCRRTSELMIFFRSTNIRFCKFSFELHLCI
jgi:hypothetical protein